MGKRKRLAATDAWKSGSRSQGRIPYLPVLLLLVITLAVFWPIAGHEFVNYDDNGYVTDNPSVKAGLSAEGIAWAFTTDRGANWHPLTWVSHMADVSLYGLKPAGHHVTNLLFHLANVMLLFLVLLRLTSSPATNPKSEIQNPKCWRCAFVAALFAIHPLHVESVAWIAERKDVLSTFFFLLTILAYVRYVEHPSAGTYAPVVLALGLGLMAKPMLVTLPFVLLLLDYWPLDRFDLRWEGEAPAEPSSRGVTTARQEPRPPDSRSSQPSTTNHQPFRRRNTQHRTPDTGGSKSNSKRLLIEKIPLFLLAAISCIVTYKVQQTAGAVSSLERLPLDIRVPNALVAYIAYIGKTIWPMGLSVLYPLPLHGLPIWQPAAAAILLVGITVLVLLAARNRPYLTVGWLWYVGTLVPVVGFVQVGLQAYADRYTYVPLIGLFVMIAWGVSELLNGRKDERTKGSLDSSSILPFTLSSILVVALATSAFIQVGCWRNSETLFRHAVAVTSNNAVAHNNLAIALDEDGKADEAIRNYRAAIKIQPDYAFAHYNLANALGNQGDPRGAMRHFREAARIQPDYWRARYNLAVMLQESGRKREAVPEYKAVIDANPGYAPAHSNLGAALLELGQVDEAISELREAIRLAPDTAEAHYNLVVAYSTKRDYAATWEEVQVCRKVGVELPAAFVDALERRMTGR